MSFPIEKFSGLFDKITDEFLLRLDRNFTTLSRQEVVFAVSQAFTLTDSDNISSVQGDATGGAFSVYLPASPTGNRRRQVTRVNGGGNNVTVDGNGSLINGSPTYALVAQYGYVEVEPTGTGWLIVNSG